MSFDNTDSVTHTVAFANGLCSFSLAPGESGGPGSWEIGVQHPDCVGINFTFFVGSYPYTVDGKFAGTVVTTPLRRSVTLTARTHTIRHGTRLTLHGRVSWFDYNPMLPREQFRVTVLARPDGRQRFEPLTTGRVWSSQVNETRNRSISYAWKRKVHPGGTTTYIAEVTAHGQVWSKATSRPFTVRTPTQAGLGPASVHATHRAARATTIRVSTHNSRYVLSARTAPRGVVIFKVENPASEPHDFSIKGRTTPLLTTGQSATLRVTFRRKGRYPYKDTFDHHAQFGCRGVLTIK